MTDTTLAPADPSRAEFEAWASNDGAYQKAIQRNGENYLLAITQSYWFAWQAARALSAPAHPDDVAVERFAMVMKVKLAAARAKGRSGWDDPAQCTQAQLSRALRDHMHKGDPVDVANFAMFLHSRGESTKLMPQPLPPGLKAAINAAPEGATVLEHNGHPVFLNRGNEDLRELADALAKIHDLCAEVVSIEYLEGEIVLRIPNNGEVPQWLVAGATVDLLYHPAQENPTERRAV